MTARILPALVLLSCAHRDAWWTHDADQRAIRVAAYRQFLVRPDSEPLTVNCLGIQSESKGPASGPVADESPDTLAVFRSGPELVAPHSACMSADPSRLPMQYHGEVLGSAKLLTIEFVEVADSVTAVVGIGTAWCTLPRGRTVCEGRGYQLRLVRQGTEWVVQSTKPTWWT